MVKIELMDTPENAPDLPVLRKWIDRDDNRLRIVETGYGASLERFRETLQFVPEEKRARFRRKGAGRNAGENSARELSDEMRDGFSPNDTALVLFEDSIVRKMIFGPHVRLMTTWSFALALERLQIIPSASGLFDLIEDSGRTPPRIPLDRRDEDSDRDFIESHDFSRSPITPQAKRPPSRPDTSPRAAGPRPSPSRSRGSASAKNRR